MSGKESTVQHADSQRAGCRPRRAQNDAGKELPAAQQTEQVANCQVGAEGLRDREVAAAGAARETDGAKAEGGQVGPGTAEAERTHTRTAGAEGNVANGDQAEVAQRKANTEGN